MQVRCHNYINDYECAWCIAHAGNRHGILTPSIGKLWISCKVAVAHGYMRRYSDTKYTLWDSSWSQSCLLNLVLQSVVDMIVIMNCLIMCFFLCPVTNVSTVTFVTGRKKNQKNSVNDGHRFTKDLSRIMIFYCHLSLYIFRCYLNNMFIKIILLLIVILFNFIIFQFSTAARRFITLTQMNIVH